MPSSSGRGGRPGGFPTTRWTLVWTLRSDDPARARAAFEQLVYAYRTPLLAHLRRLGVEESDLQDALQDFLLFAFEKGTFGKADPERGRFRTFLKACLAHFVADRRDAGHAHKRGGSARHFDVGELLRTGAVVPPQLGAPPTPDESFDYDWAIAVLEQALAAASRDYARRGRTTVYEALVGTITGEADAAGLGALARVVGLSPGSIKVEAMRLRRRIATQVREVIAETVHDPKVVEEEFRYVGAILARSRAWRSPGAP